MIMVSLQTLDSCLRLMMSDMGHANLKNIVLCMTTTYTVYCILTVCAGKYLAQYRTQIGINQLIN